MSVIPLYMYEWALPQTHVCMRVMARHLHEWVLSLICDTHAWVLWQTQSCEWVLSHDTCINESYDRHVYEWVLSHSCATHMDESCHAHVWHIWMSVATHMRVMTQLFHMCASYKLWHIHTCDPCHKTSMSHKWMSHVTRVNESCHTCEGVMSCVWMSHVASKNASDMNEERWGAGVEYHFQEFNEPYAPS